MKKYSDDLLRQEVPNSKSFRDLARKTGASEKGGSINYFKKRCLKLGIDFSHFKSIGWSKGQRLPVRTPWQERLVLRSNNSDRVRHSTLKRALLESGREHKCAGCGINPEYNGKPLILEINHKNGIVWDDRPENLEFDCPNCHSQTSTYKNRKRG